MTPSQVRKCIGVETIFPGSQASLEALREILSDLNRTETLIFCARWNLIFCSKGHYADKQERAMNWFLTIEQKERMISESGGRENVMFLFRGGLTELMRWAVLYCPATGNEPHFYGGQNFSRRNQLGKAMLIANYIWLKAVKHDSYPDLHGDELRLATLVRVRLNVSGSRVGRDPLFSLGTGYALFKDKNLFPKYYPNLEKEFYELNGKTLEEYFVCHTWIASNLLNKTEEQITTQQNHNGIFSHQTLINPVYKKFQPMLSDFFGRNKQSIDQLRHRFWGDVEDIDSLENIKPVDEMIIRNHPILEVEEGGRAVVLDPVLYGEELATGPLFKLIRNAAKNRQEKDSIMEMFGHAFEQYVCSLFRAIYKPKASRANGDRLFLNPKGRAADSNRIQISDVCIIGGDEAILIEAKSAFIPWNIVLDLNNDEYIRVLKERYVEKKGVGQLANAIINLSDNSWKPLTLNFSSIRKIYPVLIVYDCLMDSFSHSWFLNQCFIEKLRPDSVREDGSSMKGNYTISPLTLLTIDDFQNLETTARRGLPLRELLRTYEKQHPDRLMSFSDFVAFSEFNNRIYGSVAVAKITYKVIRRTYKILFPWSLRRFWGLTKYVVERPRVWWRKYVVGISNN